MVSVVFFKRRFNTSSLVLTDGSPHVMISVPFIDDVEQILPKVIPVLLGPRIESLILRNMKYVSIEQSMETIVVIFELF